MIQSVQWIAGTLTTTFSDGIVLIAPLMQEIWSIKVKWQLFDSWWQKRVNLEEPFRLPAQPGLMHLSVYNMAFSSVSF
jgi:hypothetical protein